MTYSSSGDDFVCGVDGLPFPSHHEARLHMIEEHGWPFPDSNTEFAEWLLDRYEATQAAHHDADPIEGRF